MKIYLTIILILTFTYCEFGQKKAVSVGWYQLSSESDGFSAKFPVKPVFKVDSIANLPFQNYSLSIENEFYFEVGVFEIPGATPKDMERETEVFGTSYLSVSKAKLLTKEVIRRGNCAGQEFTGITATSRKISIRIFSSGQKFYLVTFATYSDSTASNKYKTYFFDSFTINDDCNGGFSPVESPSSKINTTYLEGVYDSKTGWKKIISTTDEFQALMPARTELETQQTQIKPFPITFKTYTSHSQTAIYLVSVRGDYPDNFFAVKNAYQNSLDIMAKIVSEEFAQFHPILTLTRNLQAGSYPGREYNIKLDNNKNGRAQIFVTAKRSYVFLVFDGEAKYSTEDANKFFDSIRISVK